MNVMETKSKKQTPDNFVKLSADSPGASLHLSKRSWLSWKLSAEKPLSLRFAGSTGFIKPGFTSGINSYRKPEKAVSWRHHAWGNYRRSSGFT